eukprot:622574-Rhodomonas_salina.1
MILVVLALGLHTPPQEASPLLLFSTTRNHDVLYSHTVTAPLRVTGPDTILESSGSPQATQAQECSESESLLP